MTRRTATVHQAYSDADDDDVHQHVLHVTILYAKTCLAGFCDQYAQVRTRRKHTSVWSLQIQYRWGVRAEACRLKVCKQCSSNNVDPSGKSIRTPGECFSVLFICHLLRLKITQHTIAGGQVLPCSLYYLQLLYVVVDDCVPQPSQHWTSECLA